MIAGTITASSEAVISIEVSAHSGHSVRIPAVIDTGFTGYLLIPRTIVESLQLKVATSGQAILADGQIASFDIYDGVVIWDESRRRVDVIATEGEALVGMALLRGFRVRLDVIENGEVVIERLPADET